MPQVGVNQDPLLERLIFGYDGTNYRVVKVDTDGNLVIALKTTEDVQANSYGYVNAAWSKDPLRLGFSDTLREAFSNINLSAGANTVTGSVVPADTVWVVTNIAIVVISATITYFRPLLYTQGAQTTLDEVASPVTARYYGFQGRWVLEEDDYLGVYVAAATAGDKVYVHACGYSIDIG